MEAITAAELTTTRSFEDFFRAEYPAVYRAVLLATGDADVAQDATQEAFARGYARWRRLAKQDWAGGWVMTTALNAAKRSLRRRPAVSESARTAAPPSAATADLTAALKGLAPRQQRAVLLFYVADMPVAAIAQVMGVSEGTVKAHLSQARSKLRHTMGEDYV